MALVRLSADCGDAASLHAVRTALAAHAPHGACVVIGNFDGVHRGHQSLFRAASGSGWPVVALTFDPHPRELFGRPHARLLATEDRIRLLHEAGASAVVVLHFTAELAAMSPARFAALILARTMHTRRLILGYDFVLGHAREGTADILAGLGQTHGFDLCQMPALLDEQGEVISSTRIREFLHAGEVDKAAMQLGRPYHLTGTVTQGFQRGRQLGFPTANLALADPAPLQPAVGVYATTVRLAGSEVPLPAVTNIGRNPTFANEAVTIETHILDFSADLYGQPLTVCFHHHLRTERKFDSLEALMAQLRTDTEQAARLLAAPQV